jgi:Pyruvate/2-oxoacid:ferredoxin oxidoreductase delta subunit
MSDEVYKKLCEEMARRGGRYPGKDIPEFYALVEELFTPEEAAIAMLMTSKTITAETIAPKLGKQAKDVEAVLEGMCDKSLCMSVNKDGNRFYIAVPFVPGIFEFQFARGKFTEKDRRVARLIHAYKTAFDRMTPPPERAGFPKNRVVPIHETIRAESKVHTFNQMNAYLEKADPIAVYTCFCRHEAKLLDEKDDCGMPMEVCMLFGDGARFFIERGVARQLTKEEAKQVLRTCAEAGLVHAGLNVQNLDFICNCCSCHCMILKDALSQPKPGRVLSSGYQPIINPEECACCETCVDRCPAKALKLSGERISVDLDRCFGCGVCAVGCPMEAIAMTEKEEVPIPPANRKELEKALGSNY